MSVRCQGQNLRSDPNPVLAAFVLALIGTFAFATSASATGSVRVLATALTGAAEAPGPGDADGIGAAVIAIDTYNDTVCWLIAVRRIQLPATAAHIQVGAPASQDRSSSR